MYSSWENSTDMQELESKYWASRELADKNKKERNRVDMEILKKHDEDRKRIRDKEREKQLESQRQIAERKKIERESKWETMSAEDRAESQRQWAAQLEATVKRQQSYVDNNEQAGIPLNMLSPEEIDLLKNSKKMLDDHYKKYGVPDIPRSNIDARYMVHHPLQHAAGTREKYAARGPLE